MSRRLVIALVCAIALASVLVVVSAGGRAEESPTPTADVDFRRIGRTAPTAPVRFSLVLRLRRAAVERHLRQVNDPTSGHYRRFLSPARFGARFGVPRSDLLQLRRAITAAGLRVSESFPQRTELEVRGPAEAVERFLDTRLVDFADSDGRRFHAPSRAPTLPSSIAGPVTAAARLDNRRRWRPAAVPLGGLRPKEAAAAYNVAPLHARGLHGEGQRVAIVSFDTFDPRDVAAFDREVGIRGAPAVKRVRVAGGVDTPGEGQDEVNLDIDVIRGVAPQAQILNYEAPNGGVGFAQVLNRIVADNRTQIVSNSWGICEPDMPPEEIRADEQAFLAAAARGITMFVASGDNGAFACQNTDRDDLELAVDWPSASANVVSVGGTLLSVRTDNTYLEETGWEDVLSGYGGGGGLSETQRRPSWQRGPGVDGPQSNGMRQVPDVAASASVESGFLVRTGGELSQIGGTSAAAPFWAGSMVLVRQLAQRSGAGGLSYLNPLFYRLARRGTSPFHDVRRGGNRHHNAGSGWDYSTGLGSPDVSALATGLVELLKRRDTARATRTFTVPASAGDPSATRTPRGQRLLSELEKAVPSKRGSLVPKIRGSQGKTVAQWLEIVNSDVASFWQTRLNQVDRTYPPFGQAIFSGSVDSGCGRISQSTGAVYCSAEGTIYLPLRWFAQEIQPVGDAATAIVVAHENGHRLQDVMGALNDGSMRGIDLELQADCLAGYWAASVYRRGFLEPGDLTEVFRITSASGDAPGTPVDDPGAHGSGAQRLAAFRRGYSDGEAGDCQI